MNIDELGAEANRLSHLIDDALEAMRTYASQLATAEHNYRKARRVAWSQAPDGKGWIAKKREAWVDADTAELREVRDNADYMRQTALEAVRSRRTQMSALQTIANAHRAEAEFTRTRP